MVCIKEKPEEEETEKWVNYYSSIHQILLVGEGDFSFSLSLAQTFNSASNIVATSLDSYGSVTEKYKRAKSNLDSLQKLGASLLHGIDATKMRLHTDLKMRKFDRIVFNFPHAGFHGKEDNPLLIKRHRRLVGEFFHNARGMLRPNGEIHVNHKTSAPFCHWNLEELASQNCLLLIDCVPFKIEDYPGYNNKRGEGSRCDKPFPLGECSTFKFIFSPELSKKLLLKNRTLPQEENPGSKYGITYHSDVDQHNSVITSLFSGHVGPPVRDRFIEEFSWIFYGYLSHVNDTFGLPEERISYNVLEGVSQGYDKFVNMASGRPLGDFITFLEELHRSSLMRIEWLQQRLEDMSCYYYF